MKVLFVCVGNTCRSQMAEGWARHLGIDACSAGDAAEMGGPPASGAIEVMGEVGIDISEQRSKHISQLEPEKFDRVFTMGCEVQCPTGFDVEDDWNLGDPVGKGVEVYRETRDLIEQRVRDLLA